MCCRGTADALPCRMKQMLVKRYSVVGEGVGCRGGFVSRVSTCSDITGLDWLDGETTRFLVKSFGLEPASHPGLQ